jgi:voltage-gated potassium channel
MAGEAPSEKEAKAPMIERRVQRIVNARSATIGLAMTFLGVAIVGAVVMRIVDPDNFPNLGLAVWWALQTVTTVGYGDVVPKTVAGRVVGGVEMIIGVSFIAFVTAGVTSTILQRAEEEAQEAERLRDEQNTQTIIDSLTETKQALSQLNERLDGIQSQIAQD